MSIGVEAIVRGFLVANRPEGLVCHATESSVGNVDEVRAEGGGALAEVARAVSSVVVDDEVVEARAGIPGHGAVGTAVRMMPM